MAIQVFPPYMPTPLLSSPWVRGGGADSVCLIRHFTRIIHYYEFPYNYSDIAYSECINTLLGKYMFYGKFLVNWLHPALSDLKQLMEISATYLSPRTISKYLLPYSPEQFKKMFDSAPAYPIRREDTTPFNELSSSQIGIRAVKANLSHKFALSPSSINMRELLAHLALFSSNFCFSTSMFVPTPWRALNNTIMLICIDTAGQYRNESAVGFPVLTMTNMEIPDDGTPITTKHEQPPISTIPSVPTSDPSPIVFSRMSSMAVKALGFVAYDIPAKTVSAKSSKSGKTPAKTATTKTAASTFRNIDDYTSLISSMLNQQKTAKVDRKNPGPSGKHSAGRKHSAKTNGKVNKDGGDIVYMGDINEIYDPDEDSEEDEMSNGDSTNHAKNQKEHDISNHHNINGGLTEEEQIAIAIELSKTMG